MLVMIPFRSSAFAAGFEGFCSGDARHDHGVLVKKRRAPAIVPASSAARINC
jgi:hypothetical protein